MGILLTFFFIIAAFVGLFGATREWPAREQQIVVGSLAMHIVFSFALLGVYTFIYDGGDITAYGKYATRINTLVRFDPGVYLPELLNAFLQRPSMLDAYIYSPQSSTGSMSAITAFAQLFTADSLMATCIVFAVLSFSGKLAFYRATKHYFHPRLHFRLLIGLLYTPSAVFWTAGVVKEALAVFGLGWVLWGLQKLYLRQMIVPAIGMLLFGIFTVFHIKPYILMTIVMSITGFLALGNLRTGRYKVVKIVFGIAFGLVAITVLGRYVSLFSIDTVVERASYLQKYGHTSAGGSNIQMGSGDATSVGAQLRFMPLALINSLFRPFIFEVHNAVALINGLETAAITAMLINTFRKRSPVNLLKVFSSNQWMGFALFFVLIFGLGVGLSSTNLGTLSRYRVPMMPMYVTLLLLMQPVTPSSKTLYAA